MEDGKTGIGVGTEAAVARQSAVVEAEGWSASEVLEWGFARFGERIEMASGFGAEGMALLDIAARVRPGLRLFTTDTDFFFPETYRLIDKVERRYGIRVERLYPDLTPEQQAAAHGDELWKRNPDLCCHMRKVEPLRRKLGTLDAWITAIRREQTKARAGARKVEWDETYGLVKLNPLADWTHEQVWAYIRENDVLYNALHDRGYPSIGCTHCTRAVQAGEDLRAGRWAGMEKTECGIHWRGELVVIDPGVSS